MRIFGVTPFGWRFMGTLFGVLMLPCFYIAIKRMFGGTAVPACGTAIFAFDFMHYVQTRIATVDTYAVFFIILMYLFMYRYIVTDRKKYLSWSGIFFGIGAACKWTCLYAGAGLAVIWLAHWILKGRDFRLGAFLKNCLWCVLFFIVIPCAVYYASYYPYGAAKGMSGLGMYFTKDYADIVLKNQSFMLHYHEGVHSPHPYSSRWYQWMLDIRPILYYLQYYGGDRVSSFGAFVNPLLCWGGLLSMFAMGYLAAARRDRESAFILAGYLAQLLPWVFITRTTFEYHYFGCTVFLVLALCRIFALMRDNSARWRWPVYGFTGGCAALFAVFYPVLSGLTVPLWYADGFLRWLPTWPF
jgi:dolichyl-phosphate-mannose--protein O-mannosyl transferase